MIKVLVVDDSALYRLLLKKALAVFADIDVVGLAAGGREALAMIPALKPDVITLDMNMPDMNGMETLAVLAVKYPSVQVVVVSSQTRHDADIAVAILEAGAFEVVVKPPASDSEPMQSLRNALHPILQAAAQYRPPARSVNRVTPARTLPQAPPQTPLRKSSLGLQPDIVAIGSSTGGPAALHKVLANIKPPLPVPIIIVQHMPKLFIESLATRLGRETGLHCCVAADGMALAAGAVYFAPGESHMDIVRGPAGTLAVSLHQSAAEHHCRPAVDVTLRSLHVLSPGIKTLVVILTGMGKDGAAGAKLLAAAKATVIAQDKASSVVWGMPGETVRLGAAAEVLPLNQIAAAINRTANQTADRTTNRIANQATNQTATGVAA